MRMVKQQSRICDKLVQAAGSYQRIEVWKSGGELQLPQLDTHNFISSTCSILRPFVLQAAFLNTLICTLSIAAGR
ncbi:unnamed protein product [Sphagnum jensenii]|uniref:Uncharacterized protein n=1 Tax=Sphagnum jensenii TaxID=128206 RepID=A0ABP1AEG2_9BRYO